MEARLFLSLPETEGFKGMWKVIGEKNVDGLFLGEGSHSTDSMTNTKTYVDKTHVKDNMDEMSLRNDKSSLLAFPLISWKS